MNSAGSSLTAWIIFYNNNNECKDIGQGFDYSSNINIIGLVPKISRKQWFLNSPKLIFMKFTDVFWSVVCIKKMQN